jgi:hypothetical protein
VQTVIVPAGGGAVFDVKIDAEASTRSSRTLRGRRSRPGRPAQGRQPQGDDVPLSWRTDRRLRLAAVLCTAAALAGALVAASVIGARDEGPAPAPAAAPEPEPSLFAGIEQRGAALGSPRAPVTLVEYADLQCPYCAQWARDALPTLVDDYVRAGSYGSSSTGLRSSGPTRTRRSEQRSPRGVRVTSGRSSTGST